MTHEDEGGGLVRGGPVSESRRGQLAETRRLEAFSDGVLAIVITLLVLDLHAPEARGEMLAQLLDQWPAYVAYGATFVYVGVIWLNHHHLFTRLRAVDAGLLWRNLLLLLATSVLPFPTSVLGSAFQFGNREDQIAGAAFYALTTATVVGAWVLIYRYLGKNPRLHARNTAPTYFTREGRRSLLGFVGFVAAAGLALLQPALGLALCWGITLVYVVTTESGAFRTRPA